MVEGENREMGGDLVLARDAARLLDVSLVTLTNWDRSGTLRPALRLGNYGLRVYRLADVERVARERQAAEATEVDMR